MTKRRRKDARFLIDLPMRLSARGTLLDEAAVVHDLTLEGFGFETTHRLERGQRITFEVSLPGDSRAAGEAEVRWLRSGDWGQWAGARITRMSWADKRRVSRAITAPGYDWPGFWDRALTAAFIIAVVFLVDDVVRHQQGVLEAGWRVLPDLIAVACMGASALWFLRSRRR